jgi:hypothetical protein
MIFVIQPSKVKLSYPQEPTRILLEDQLFFFFLQGKFFEPFDLRDGVANTGIIGGKEDFFGTVLAD